MSPYTTPIAARVKADKRLFGGRGAAAVSATGRSRVVENGNAYSQ
jgi:hypothetical protein